MSLVLKSPAFGAGERIPDRYTCEGDNISPPLEWSGAPAGTRSFALFCDDPDAPGKTWHHWGVFGIAASRNGLAEKIPTGAVMGSLRQATTDFRRSGYGGPCPPPGHGVHHYHFRLMALDVPTLELEAGVSCTKAARAAARHALATAELVGTYSR